MENGTKVFIGALGVIAVAGTVAIIIMANKNKKNIPDQYGGIGDTAGTGSAPAAGDVRTPGILASGAGIFGIKPFVFKPYEYKPIADSVTPDTTVGLDMDTVIANQLKNKHPWSVTK